MLTSVYRYAHGIAAFKQDAVQPMILNHAGPTGTSIASVSRGKKVTFSEQLLWQQRGGQAQLHSVANATTHCVPGCDETGTSANHRAAFGGPERLRRVYRRSSRLARQDPSLQARIGKTYKLTLVTLLQTLKASTWPSAAAATWRRNFQTADESMDSSANLPPNSQP